ncbi:MAG: signal peptide peptidase SppA [Thiotrichales bacterium]|nr:signal peptide peptidase SppA [Thiotrichales bacterium]
MNVFKLQTPILKLAGLLTLFLSLLLMSGCANINLAPSYNKPFKEQVVQDVDNATAKVLIIDIAGTIDDQPKGGFLSQAPSLMDSVLMQLKKAEKDPQVKTVLLKINSPGGGVTASDILYHELIAFKARTQKKVFIQMMDVAASGGYYIAMAGDHIQAHPTTVTGSVGVISVSADLSGIMDKVGVGVNVYKTGVSKDMGAPFRSANDLDKQLFQELVEQMAMRFYEIVQSKRQLSDEAMAEVKSARIYTGLAAKQAGLVDSLGYLSQATQAACELAGEQRCNVVTYRYQSNENVTAYSPSMATQMKNPEMSLLNTPILDSALNLKPGMYYLMLQ